MVSCLPASTAVIEPDPATVDIIVASMGTGDSRALNDSPFGVFCAPAACPIHANPNHRITAPSKSAVNLRRLVVSFFNAQTLFLEIAEFTFKSAQIIRGLSQQFKLIGIYQQAERQCSHAIFKKA
jgi:hypothetical protein